MIEAVGLSHVYPSGHQAVCDLNLRVEPGEVYCLLGANGAGKTTTMNMLLGFLRPSAGHALIDGLDPAREPLASRGRLAYIPEQVALYPHLSGRENLAYLTRLAGHRLSRADLTECLVGSGLAAAHLDRPAGGYSKGMRQKVAIALARARQARVLLLDEPTSGLDPQASHEFSQLVLRLAGDRVAILMATHDLFRVKEMGARVGIMKAGRLLEEMSTADVSHVDLERVYLEHMR